MDKQNYSGCTISMHHCGCLEKLTVEERRELDQNSVVVNYRRGELICKQGSFASHVILIESGLAKVFIDNGTNSLVLKIIPDGNLLGLTSVNEDHNTFQYSAMAYIDTRVKQVNISFFRQLLSRNPEFAKEIINILSSNNVLINGRFFCLTHKQSYGRLADIILCLSDRIFKSQTFNLQLSRDDLAELTHMRKETLIRMLKSFKEEGLIEIEGKNFRVLDKEKLRRISEIG